MTLCNMAIEAGARVGLVAVDDITIEYAKDKPKAPTAQQLEEAIEYWKTLHSDEDAVFDKRISIEAKDITRQVTWGTSPEMVIGISDVIPNPADSASKVQQKCYEDALDYIHLKHGTPLSEVYVDKVFIGSCTNSRIEDLRIAAMVAKGNRVAHNIKLAMVVPGSGLVKAQAEAEGLDKIFIESGFEWREPGCSMCLAMNADKLEVGERCASTSNRNFEGRQGQGSFTHLVSPYTAAMTAICGHFA